MSNLIIKRIGKNNFLKLDKSFININNIVSIYYNDGPSGSISIYCLDDRQCTITTKSIFYKGLKNMFDNNDNNDVPKISPSLPKIELKNTVEDKHIDNNIPRYSSSTKKKQ